VDILKAVLESRWHKLAGIKLTKNYGQWFLTITEYLQKRDIVVVTGPYKINQMMDN